MTQRRQSNPLDVVRRDVGASVEQRDRPRAPDERDGAARSAADRESRRIALAPDALLEGRNANDLLTEIVETIAAPRM